MGNRPPCQTIEIMPGGETKRNKRIPTNAGFSCVMSGLSIECSTVFYKSDWLHGA